MMSKRLCTRGLKLTNSECHTSQISTEWFINSVSPFASDLLIGLLDKDHRKRYDLKMIEKHEWVKHGPDTGESLDSIEQLDISDKETTFEV